MVDPRRPELRDETASDDTEKRIRGVSAALRKGTCLLGLAVMFGACAAPQPQKPPGRDVMIVVRNTSPGDVDLAYTSEGSTSSSTGEASLAGCTSTLVAFGGAQDRITILADGQQVVEVDVPSGTDGYFVVPLFVGPDRRISAGQPVVSPVPPLEPPAPVDCGSVVP